MSLSAHTLCLNSYFDFNAISGNNILMKRIHRCQNSHEFNHISLYNTSKNHSCDGMILVTILILVGLITALVIQAQVSARLALRTEERKCLKVQLRAAATDAAWNALYVLACDNDRFVDHTNEPWACPTKLILPNGIETVVLITDENRFFNVNNLSVLPSDKTVRSPSDIVIDLLKSCDISHPEVRTQNLKDWMNMDHEMTRYAPLGITLIESPDEFARVLGVTLCSTKIPRMLTVLPGRRAQIVPVNINTAGREVLLGVMGSHRDALVDSICRFRDSQPLTSLAPLARFMDVNSQRKYQGYLDVKSRFFSVVAYAFKNGLSEEVYGLAYRNNEGVIEIMRWICRS